MLRSIVYLAAFASGIGWALTGPAAAACVMALTYLMNPGIFVPIFDSLRIQLISSLILVAVLIQSPRRPTKTPAARAPIWLLCAYAAMAVASTGWAVVNRDLALTESTQFAKTTFFVVLLTYALRSERDLRLFVWTCILGTFHGALAHVVGTKFGYLPERFAQEMGVFPDEHAGVILAMLPLAMVQAFCGQTRKERWSCWVISGMLVLSIVNTFRRAPIIGLAAEVAILAWLLPRKALVRGLPVALLLVAALLIRSTPETWWDRMSTIMDPRSEASANSRFVIFDAYWQMAQDYPQGVGYRNSPWVAPDYLSAEWLTVDVSSTDPDQGRIRSAHNTYLEILTETGFQGFALWSSAVGLSLLAMYRMIGQTRGLKAEFLNSTAIAVVAGSVGWLVAGLAVGQNQVDPAYWLIGIGVVAQRLATEKRLQACMLPRRIRSPWARVRLCT
jgi:O-antigen ligase